eukprot:1418115-Rhodomonas_salina.1
MITECWRCVTGVTDTPHVFREPLPQGEPPQGPALPTPIQVARRELGQGAHCTPPGQDWPSRDQDADVYLTAGGGQPRLRTASRPR